MHSMIFLSLILAPGRLNFKPTLSLGIRLLKFGRISLLSHHGSYIYNPMRIVHSITFSSVHDIAILCLLPLNSTTDATYGIPGTCHINIRLVVFVLSKYSLTSITTDES